MSLVLTIRLIKSFEYRNYKNLVLKNIPSSFTIHQLKSHILQGNNSHFNLCKEISTRSWKPFQNIPFGNYY